MRTREKRMCPVISSAAFRRVAGLGLERVCERLCCNSPSCVLCTHAHISIMAVVVQGKTRRTLIQRTHCHGGRKQSHQSLLWRPNLRGLQVPFRPLQVASGNGTAKTSA